MKKYDVVGIGNAIVDVFAQADDSFLELMGIEKGIMQLVERERESVRHLGSDVTDAITSAVVAVPVFSTKLACFSEMLAVPIRKPRRPS